MSSVLRLCQRLLEGPEEQSSEAERQSLQLLQVNLERRWEAIIMQVLQWQSRLKHTLGREQVRYITQHSDMHVLCPARMRFEQAAVAVVSQPNCKHHVS